MILEQVAATMDVVGKVMVSYAVIKVHHRMLKEHQMDEAVYREIKTEQKMGFVSIGLMVGAYLLKLLVQAGLLS